MYDVIAKGILTHGGMSVGALEEGACGRTYLNQIEGRIGDLGHKLDLGRKRRSMRFIIPLHVEPTFWLSEA